MIISVNSHYIPAPGFIFQRGIFAGNHMGVGRQLNVVAVEKHDQVAQPEVTGNPAG
ncbi:hypothetical protein DSECCO2_526940 [anaerobic digester metagenome]